MLVQAVAICVVFSAHAEVVPYPPSLLSGVVSILRARGGSSGKYDPFLMAALYSPRTRR